MHAQQAAPSLLICRGIGMQALPTIAARISIIGNLPVAIGASLHDVSPYFCFSCALHALISIQEEQRLAPHVLLAVFQRKLLQLPAWLAQKIPGHEIALECRVCKTEELLSDFDEESTTAA